VFWSDILSEQDFTLKYALVWLKEWLVVREDTSCIVLKAMHSKKKEEKSEVIEGSKSA
jgi:hypothetical protein